MYGIASLALVTALSGCTVRPQISNTGFTGTWARSGGMDTFHSQVSIIQDGGRYLFRWRLDSNDGTWHVRCGWDGKCEEFLDGAKVADYAFDVRERPEGGLTIECTRVPVRKEVKGYHYTDVLEVDLSGKSLVSYTVELNGDRFAKETATRKILTKISDTVADPPIGTRS